MELHEHYETFIERKEQCIRHLNAVKATMKLMMIGGVSIYANNNQNLELCKSLYKLFFQLLLMSDKFDEMIKFIQNLTNSQRENYYDDQSFLYDIDRNFWEICCVWKDEKTIRQLD
ncbi:unnamed protein product [Dracunculus medinensis]|uniref:Fry_C domain-containing protein n=1 Tax=Dracunculus medinensis TaxID=318479 RepID=A0A0N4UKE9_DRAME|nr:unnamed protein product [Dracunculus medinensis]